jgi:hypothetical protein
MATILESPLLVLCLDQEGILHKIQSVIDRLFKNPDLPYSSNSLEANKALFQLMRETIKLSKTGWFPALGSKLFEKFQELDRSVNCSVLLDKDWREIKDDEISLNFLEAITYLKLALMCSFDDAKTTYADLLEKNILHDIQPHRAVRFVELITIYNQTSSRVVCVNEFHEFVASGLYFVCKAYSKSCPHFKFYKALLKSKRDGSVPWGLIHGYDGDATDTGEMVNFLINAIEEQNM